jgi:protoheme IX farnesyltransferase
MTDLFVLTKVRLNTLVVFTTAAGYYMASTGPVDLVNLMLVCFGTALVAGGSAAFNQVHERDVDALLDRTRSRPVPQGRVTTGRATVIAYLTSIAGLAILLFAAHWLAAVIALATLLLYVVIYTPMKRRSSLATIVGAVPGALPPMIGWAAVRGSVDAVSWTLFAIMFFWQLPHFLAIGWMFRDDYAKASMPMLPVIDTSGAVTGRQALIYAAALVPVSVMPMLFGMTGRAYGIGALLLGVFLVAVAAGFAVKRTRDNARMLFLSSITYLPLLLALMAAGRRV